MKRAACTPSLFAPDVAAAVAFYEDVFTFQRSGSYTDGGELVWAEVTLGEARIWFFRHALDDRPTPVFSGLIYVFVDDVDDMAARLGGKAQVDWGPETQDYGLRELGVRDLNGYRLVFARDADELPRPAASPS